MNSEENFSFSIFPLSAMNHNENYLENGLFFMQIGCHKKALHVVGIVDKFMDFEEAKFN